MKKASDYRRIARDTLQGKWYAAGAVCLVAALLGAVPAGGGNRVTLSLETMKSWLNEYPVFWAVILFFLVYWILVTVISGAVTMGNCIFHLRLLEGKETVFADLFSQLHRVKTGFILVLRASVSVFLWMLLFFIPGLIKSISYVMAPYILAENPGMRAKDALKKSVELMKGNKWRYFCLHMSFIGWHLLAAVPAYLLSRSLPGISHHAGSVALLLWAFAPQSLTFVISAFLLWPYVLTARAAFYRDLVQCNTEETVKT